MNLSRQQLAAVDAVTAWFRDGADEQQVFRLFGYAGTGKTTIARHIADEIGARVQFATFTGKAAHVLQSKGCANEEEDNHSRPSFTLNLTSDLTRSDLLILDEVSMVGKQIADDLRKFKVPILCLGDPAQLPPVKDEPELISAEPDVLLTEIHRQAAESPVLRMATSLRETGDYGGGPIYERGGMGIEQVAAFDQIIVGTNATRRRSIDKLRAFHCYTGTVPNVGERLICTRNDHELGLLNGSQWIVREAFDDGADRILFCLESVEDGTMLRCEAHAHPFRGEEIPYFELREAQCFDFAYAITVHRAQGSEWPRVCIIDEAHKFPSSMRRSWRYTAVTRAAEEVAIIR